MRQDNLIIDSHVIKLIVRHNERAGVIILNARVK
jgi:hypothetical protein